jgi:hypothetical protein
MERGTESSLEWSSHTLGVFGRDLGGGVSESESMNRVDAII